MTNLNKKQIIDLLPHRDPMLLIDELYNIKKLHSANAVVNVKKDSFFVQGHFPGQPVMPGVLIVESFGQAAAALTAHGLDRSTYENNVSTFSFLINASNSLNDKNVRLSERLFISGQNLRGFESGKIGPKDGSDFIGGNFSAAINLTTNLPKLTENFQNLDLGLFLDAANIWGVDYDTTLENNSGIRSSIGVGVDLTTPIGPLTFSLATPITKEDNDVTETFRFNIGTSF